MQRHALSSARQRPSWLAISFVLAVVLLLVVTIPALGGEPDLGVRTRPLEDGTRLVTWVVPTSYAWDAGLRPGDRIRVLSRLEGSPALAVFEVIPSAGGGPTVKVASRWPPSVDILLILLCLEFLAAGLFVHWKASERPTASLFLLLSGMASIAFLTSVTTASIDQVWTICLNWLSTKLAPLAFAYFFCSVPVCRWILPLRVLALALLPLAIWYTYAMLVDARMFDAVRPFSTAYTVGVLLLSVLALVRPFVTRTPSEHRRMFPVAVSGAVAMFFFLGSSLIPE